MTMRDRLWDTFNYDPESGVLVWKNRPRRMFKNTQAWLSANTRLAGKQVKSLHNSGYLTVRFEYKALLVHRVIWCMVHGDFPQDGFELDHINGDRTDNRFINLRLVDRTANCQNMGLRSDNASGHVGVYWHRRASKWCAIIKADKKRYHLGLYSELEFAVAARKKAEVKHGFHPNHGRTK